MREEDRDEYVRETSKRIDELAYAVTRLEQQQREWQEAQRMQFFALKELFAGMRVEVAWGAIAVIALAGMAAHKLYF